MAAQYFLVSVSVWVCLASLPVHPSVALRLSHVLAVVDDAAMSMGVQLTESALS